MDLRSWSNRRSSWTQMTFLVSLIERREWCIQYDIRAPIYTVSFRNQFWNEYKEIQDAYKYITVNIKRVSNNIWCVYTYINVEREIIHSKAPDAALSHYVPLGFSSCLLAPFRSFLDGRWESMYVHWNGLPSLSFGKVSRLLHFRSFRL